MITSRKNPKVQQLRLLLTKKAERNRQQLCVAEGTRLLEEAIQCNWKAVFGFYSHPLDERSEIVLQQCRDGGAEMEEVPSDLLQFIADTKNPQGLIAVFEINPIPAPTTPTFVLVLDALRDPGNMGTILRSAAAAGVDHIFLTNDCVDPFSPKVLRSGMGAQFRLPIQMMDIEQILQYSKQKELNLYIADSNTNRSCWQENFKPALALVIGNEANGPSKDFFTAQAKSVKIPMPGGFESLNAAVAAGILMFEIVHQRIQ
jgi:RNA methyltransferase, TrmH family